MGRLCGTCPACTIHCPVRKCHHRSGSVAVRAVIASSPKKRIAPNNARVLHLEIRSVIISPDYRIIGSITIHDPSSPARKRKFLITLFLISMCGCNVLLFFQSVPKLRRGYQDFTIYYTGGLMVREGHVASLYDLEAQYQTQLRFCDVPVRHGGLPFNHPVIEALMFVPFTLLSFWHAYVIWTALSLVMLAASLALLRRFPAIRAVHPALLAVGALSFFPLANGMLQGQDSIFLMFLTVVALTCLDGGADATAGALLGLGLFRPHMALPLALLLAVRRWRLLLGFIPVLAVLAAITVAVTGWAGVAFISASCILSSTRASATLAPKSRRIFAA